ncbi:hypothetical protein VTK56DRAFT_4914 [Thermocarpiscus australiensis]
MSNTTANLAAVLPSAGSNLVLQERAIPSPGPDEVLIRNHAIAVNPIDWKRQAFGFYISSYPTILGVDVSGVVEAVGSAVTSVKKGDRVLGCAPVIATGNPDHAAFQHYTLVQASAVAKLPATLDFKQAATLPASVATAAITLFDVFGLPLPQPTTTTSSSSSSQAPGIGIMVWSGASSAGNATIQLARLAGLTVFASASPRHHARVRALGAAAVVDYQSPTAVADLAAAARRAGVEIRYAVDAVSTAETLPLVLDFLDRVGGGEQTKEKKKLAHLWYWPEEQVARPTDEGVEVTFVKGSDVWTERRDLAARVFNGLLGGWLENGEVVPQTARVIEGGLGGLQTALDTLRKGLKCQILVDEVSDKAAVRHAVRPAADEAVGHRPSTGMDFAVSAVIEGEAEVGIDRSRGFAVEAEVPRLEPLNSKSTDPKMDAHLLPMPLPGFGTSGAAVTLWANYVQVIAAPDLVLYRYALSVSPNAAGRKLTQIIRLVLEAPELAELQQDMVSDFKSTCVSRQKLPRDDMTIPVTYRAEGEDEPRQGAISYNVRIQYTNTLSVGELTEYLTSTDLAASCDNKQPLIQAFNIFLNHYAKTARNTCTIGSARAFSLPPDAPKWDLGGGLSAIRGFFASVRAATCRILVNVNVTHAAFYKDGPLDQLMVAFDAQRRGGKTKLALFLKRVRVRTTHLKEKKNKAGEVIYRVKTIVGLATPNDGHGLAHPPRVREFGAGPRLVEFWLDSGPPEQPGPATEASGTQAKKKKKGGKGERPDVPAASSSSGGRYISVYEFFLNTYGITLRRPDLPVVNVGTRENPTYLPPEVCVVMPGQSANSKLDPGQTQQMIRFAVRKPADNANSIVHEGLSIVGLSNTNVLLNRFGISVSRNLITVPGRVLGEPKVFYKDKKVAQVRLGSWNMIDVKFNTIGTLKRWSYLMISLPTHRDAFTKDSLAAAVKQFTNTMAKTGISVADPLPGQRLELDNPDDTRLDQRLEAAAQKLELLLIILPDAITPLYNRIKHCGDVKYGIHTVCCVGHKFAKCSDQYFANVALKFNLKLGGSNQLLDASCRGLIDEDKTMVVGIDVTHPSPGSSSSAPSIAGMVASVDRWLGQWPAVLRVQPEARREMVADLRGMLASRLRLWTHPRHGRHASLPENILVYRDGVSEGQYQAVLDEEVPLLRQACEDMYPPADTKRGLPRLTVVVVGKRHHTRFYASREADADRSANPKPGTVVDRGVTEARNWDFFLQSHAALQGTARPAHYFVVLDEIFRARYAGAKGKTVPLQNVADVLEALTQSMCYTYGRATKAVSVCTPAYYADVVCERARCYLSGAFETPSQSTAGSVGGEQPAAAVTSEDVLIHERLRDTMFYI